MSETACDKHALTTVKELFSILDAQGGGDYLGERISQLQHSLQAATLAQQAGADDETVLAALLHDIGRFIPAADKMSPILSPDGVYLGKASHEILGEHYLRQLGFSEKVCQLVGAHVMAKRYLTAVDKTYYDGLSKSSKLTLKAQGGSFNEEEVKLAQGDPLLQEKLAVRRWDDLAKNPDFKTEPLSAFQDIAVASLKQSRMAFTLHGRQYRLPTQPTVVVCVDGFDPVYLEKGIKDEILPNLARFEAKGFHAVAKCAMPSFTNPNNVSIITGSSVAVHGITGNYLLDRKTGEEHMIVNDSLLRGSTILEQLAKRGVRVAAVTAKDKLRAIISHGLSSSEAICFSAEKATSCTKSINGIAGVEEWLGQAQPSQYSGELSLFVMDAGIKLLEENRADVLYLTLSDYIQHKYAPESKEANSFYLALDQKIGRLVELGAQVAVTGDHGMSDKCGPDGKPNVLFLEDALAEAGYHAKVICPITDPFVRHHGALGSFVRVYLDSQDETDKVAKLCRSFPQVELALPAEEAAETLELALDREGDIVVVSKKNAVIGGRKEQHDLSQLGDHRLRSHGGLSEQDIPLLMSRPASDIGELSDRQWRNFDIFDLILNH